MKLQDIFRFKVGTKFQLQDEWKYGLRVLPKGLVISLVSVHYNTHSFKLKFKVIRSKDIIREVYDPIGILPEAYVNKMYPGNYTMLYFRDAVADRFITDTEVIDFTSEYDRITSTHHGEAKLDI